MDDAVIFAPRTVVGQVRRRFRGRPALDEHLIGHCRQSLARYKVPREVYIEEMLPKNAVGKIAKPELRQRLQDASAPESA